MDDLLVPLTKFKEDEPLAVELLTRAWVNKKLTHAYIFTGINKEKVNSFVNAFSKILLCDSKTGSDNCINCKVFDHGQHPDFRIWSPNQEKSKYIKLEQVHELISSVQRKPITSKHQVLIMQEINMLRVEGSNALLKTLEEPASYTTIILTVDTLEHVLTTILSRCQIIPIKSPIDNIEEEYFDLKSHIPESYIKANEMSNELFGIDTEELTKFLIKIQNELWNLSKSKSSVGENLSKQVELLDKIEYYIKAVDSYVNQKMIIENLYIDLFEYKNYFFD